MNFQTDLLLEIYSLFNKSNKWWTSVFIILFELMKDELILTLHFLIIRVQFNHFIVFLYCGKKSESRCILELSKQTNSTQKGRSHVWILLLWGDSANYCDALPACLRSPVHVKAPSAPCPLELCGCRVSQFHDSVKFVKCIFLYLTQTQYLSSYR